MRYVRIALLMGLVGVLPFIAAAQKKLPDVKVRTLDGNEINLRQWVIEGKKNTVISFWATWCTPCKRELDNMNDFVDEWSRQYNARFVALSIDNTRNMHKVAPYAKGKGWKYELLLDPNGNTRRALNYMMIPYLVVVNTEGEIVYKHIGYQEGDELEVEEVLMKLMKSGSR